MGNYSRKRARRNRQVEKPRAIYKREFPMCQRPGCSRRAAELHEIARGSGIRKDSIGERAAWLHLCWQDHRACDDYSKVPVVLQLAWKKISDPDGYDRVTVNRLRGKQPGAITEDDVDAAVERVLAAGIESPPLPAWKVER